MQHFYQIFEESLYNVGDCQSFTACGSEEIMKKFLALFLVLILGTSTLSGCFTPATEPEETKPVLSSEDAKIIDKLTDILKDSENLQEDIVELTEDLIDSCDKYDKQIADMQISGGTFDPQQLIKDMGNSQEDIDGFTQDIESLSAKVDKLKKPDSAQTVKCVEATTDYISMLSGCLEDLDGVIQFYLDQDKAMGPIDEIEDSTADEEDYLAIIDILYTAVDETVKNLSEIKTCPEYMKESFAIYVRKISVYQNMLDSLYMGYAFSDPLRISSSMQLYDRSVIEEVKYSIEIFHLVKLQFEKVAERLNDSISGLRDEIETACKSIDKAEAKLPKISFSYQNNDPEVSVSFEAVDTIYPSLYNSMDSVINFTASTNYGDVNALIKVEIPGLTQVYKQKVEFTHQVSKFLIKPALLTKGLDLSSSRETQIIFSVVNEDSGKTIIQESHNVAVQSVYDFALTDDEFGVVSRDNVLSWLTPESEGILELRRNAVSWVEKYTEGEANALVGYQDYGLFEDVELNTVLQIIAIQASISDTGVRYNNGAFSLSSETNQRVLLPDAVLESKSGICIETAILFASAIQSAGMHPMIIFLPGHAQVAVETWEGSGQYFLVETTLLPFTGTDEENELLVTYMTNEEWLSYLEDPYGDGSGGCYVVDCDLVLTLGMQGITY